MNEEANISKEFTYRTEDIFKEYYAPLCYFAERFLKDDVNVVEDIVQDVFVILLEKSPSFESLEHLKNFLYLSVKNACLNHRRRLISKERYFTEKSTEEESEEPIIHEMITTEVYRELAVAVANLPTECRKVFELCYFEELPNEEVAEKLGISIFTVKAQKARGKKILKENLKELFPILVALLEFV